MTNPIYRMPAPSPVDHEPLIRPQAQPATQSENSQCFPRLAALLALAALALLAACGASSYVAPPIAVTFTPAFPPPSAMTFNPPEQCGVAATVTNDSKNQGVSWTATCDSSGAGACGTFTPLIAKSASTVPITYTAPAAAPTGGTVTLTATSITDPTKSISSSPIAIGSTSSGCTAP